MISMFHEAGQVERIEHERGAVVMQGRVPGRLLAQYTPWFLSNTASPEDNEEFIDETSSDEEKED